MGRKPILTEEIKSKFIAAIRAGNYLTTAARWIGVHPRTVYKWLERGENEPGIYADLLQEYQAANGAAEIFAVTIVKKAMEKDWRAAITFLERRFPDRWRRSQTTEAEKSGPEQKKTSHNEEWTSGDLAAIAKHLIEIGALDGSGAENKPEDRAA